MLIHGLVYAANGHWQAARTLALVALDAANGLSVENKKGRFGREAAYLQAIAVRRLARSSGDLQEARHLLDLAKTRDYEEDGIDPRFRAEELAQWMAEIQFMLFNEQTVTQGKVRLSEQFFYKWDTAVHLATFEAQRFATHKQDHPQQRWLQRQNATNALLLANLFALFNGSPVDAIRDRVMHLANQFSNWGLAQAFGPGPAPKVIYPDAISDFVHAIAIALFSRDRAQREKALASARRLPATMTPIDRVRFPKLLAAAEAEVSRRDT
jgi:hypothetical protein